MMNFTTACLKFEQKTIKTEDVSHCFKRPWFFVFGHGMITFLGLICDSRHLSIRSKSVDLTSNLSSKIPSREEANTTNLDIQVISDCNHDNFKRQVQISFLPWCKSLIGCTIKGLSLVLESIPASVSRAVLPNPCMTYLITKIAT